MSVLLPCCTRTECRHDQTHRPKITGFTLIEMMVVVAVIGILALIALPSTLNQRLRSETVEVMRAAETVREAVTEHYRLHLTFPEDNAEAGLPEPAYLIGNRYSEMLVEDGAIHITFGNKANKALQGRVLTIRPAVVTDSPASPIAWLCGLEEPVSGMEAVGENRTDLPEGVAPSRCPL